MTDDLCALCALNGEVLFHNKEYADKEILNWEEIYRLSHKQFVVSTVVYAVTDKAPMDLRKKWILDAYHIEKHNYNLYQSNLYITSLLENHNIPYVILKGVASASYYKKNFFRVQGDIDFLVPPDRINETKDLLEANGFLIEIEVPFEIGYTKEDVTYELHTEASGIPKGEKESEVRKYLTDIIDTAVPLNIDGGTVMIPDDFHHGLLLLLHTAKHLVSFGLGLRQISDWAVFVNHIGEGFPLVFQKPLEECGLWEFAKAISEACVRYLNMPPLSWTGKFDEGFLDSLMEDFLRKGGLHHDENDDMDALFVEKTDEGGVSHSPMLSQLLKNLSGKARFRWPFMKKVVILLPFGICIMCVQYLWGTLTGKYQKINMNSLLKKAQARRDLYEELHLFR